MLLKTLNQELEKIVTEYKNISPSKLITQALNTIKYKPNFKFFENTSGLSIMMEVVSSSYPYDTISVSHNKYYDKSIIDLESAKIFIYKMIKEMEIHEIHEYLKFDNKHLIDPHPEQRYLLSFPIDIPEASAEEKQLMIKALGLESLKL